MHFTVPTLNDVIVYSGQVLSGDLKVSQTHEVDTASLYPPSLFSTRTSLCPSAILLETNLFISAGRRILVSEA
jgi:hypothetical protein